MRGVRGVLNVVCSECVVNVVIIECAVIASLRLIMGFCGLLVCWCGRGVFGCCCAGLRAS